VCVICELLVDGATCKTPSACAGHPIDSCQQQWQHGQLKPLSTCPLAHSCGSYSCAPTFIALLSCLQAAITLLEEKGKLPALGVHTPASLLWGTGYVDRLRAHGIKFEVVDSAAVQ